MYHVYMCIYIVSIYYSEILVLNLFSIEYLNLLTGKEVFCPRMKYVRMTLKTVVKLLKLI